MTENRTVILEILAWEKKDDDATGECPQGLYGLELEAGHWLRELTTLTTARK